MSRVKSSTPITSLADLTPDPRNANLGTERGGGVLERSLRETGAGRSILVDKHGRVIAGNKTLEHWAALADDAAIKVVETDGQTLVVVQRQDLDLEDPAGLARKLAYYDNRTSELNLAWNAEEVLRGLQAGVDLNNFWTPGELETLLGKIALPSSVPPERPETSEVLIEIRCSKETLAQIEATVLAWSTAYAGCSVTIA